MDWEEGEEDELLASIEEGADRLADLVDNLLAMSRVQAGALSVHPRRVALDEVVGRALLSTGSRGVEVAVPEDLPAAWVDPGLLERVLANLVANAVRWSPADHPVRVSASELGETLVVQVVDRGPGVSPGRWDEMFQPFQRLGDTSPDGVGLGLAIARGLTEALGGRLAPGQTEGGGLTMSVTVPVAR
jgi:two-component system sensor histidine kinase KdpD